jgi:hypothetical protein
MNADKGGPTLEGNDLGIIYMFRMLLKPSPHEVGGGSVVPWCVGQRSYIWAREKREPGRVGMPPARQSGQSSGS